MLVKDEAEHKRELQCVQEDHVTVLHEHEAKAERMVRTTNTIQTLVYQLEQIHTDHLARVRHSGPGDCTGGYADSR